MSWVSAYIAMSSALGDDSPASIASLAQAPARVAEGLGRETRKERAELLARELAQISAAIDEAAL